MPAGTQALGMVAENRQPASRHKAGDEGWLDSEAKGQSSQQADASIEWRSTENLIHLPPIQRQPEIEVRPTNVINIQYSAPFLCQM
jgi:hypothetical protein